MAGASGQQRHRSAGRGTADLRVRIGSVEFPNPVMVASGTFCFAPQYHSMTFLKQLGAIVPKTVTLQPQHGNPPPRIIETPAGMLNAIGIENPGLEGFIRDKLPSYCSIGVPVIVSVLGYSPDEFARMTARLDEVDGPVGYELNLSCPNLRQKNIVAQDPKAVGRVVGKVRRVTKRLVIAKLAPNVTDIAVIARAAEEAGADAVSLINTFFGLAIDVERRRPVLGNLSGGLSGPAIRPAALYLVWRAATAVSVPVIGMGGIADARDALEFLIAGASMVAVGTVNFIDPQRPLSVIRGIADHMKRHRIRKIEDLVASLKTS